MKSINPNKREDLNNRYKFDDPVVEIVHSKGDYTKITNLKKISEQLSQPEMVLLRFLGKIHGSNIFEDKNSISGKISKEKIDEYLDIYIENFVICPGCQDPETIPYLEGQKKKIELKIKCNCCGKISTILSNKNKKIENSRLLIIKELEKGTIWKVKQGNMVIKENKSQSINNNSLENEMADFNPFD